MILLAYTTLVVAHRLGRRGRGGPPAPPHTHTDNGRTDQPEPRTQQEA